MRDTKGILTIAEGGAAAYAPTHTLAAFDLAVEQDAHLLGLTLHLSADGHPVVIQSDRLEPTTDGRGRVDEWTLRDLKRLDAGGWFGERFKGQRIQTLTEILERFKDHAGFWIELSAGSQRYPGIEERTVSLVQIYGVGDRSWICSADLKALSKVRDMDPALARVFSCPSGERNWHDLDPSCGNGIVLNDSALDESSWEVFRTKGLKVFVRVEDPQAIPPQRRSSLAGMLTTRPDLLRNLLPPP